MSKAQIAQIVGLISLIVGALFHIEVTQELQLNAVELIAAVVSVGGIIVGMIKEHQNKKNTP